MVRLSGGSEFHAAGPACEKARSSNLVRGRWVTYLLLEADRRPVRVAALLDGRMMSLRYGEHSGGCVFRTWSCTVWSQYDSGSAASAAPSGLAWCGRERPADGRGVLQRSGYAAMARVLTGGRWLVLRYSSPASTWQVKAPAMSWLLLRRGGVSDAADASGSSSSTQ